MFLPNSAHSNTGRPATDFFGKFKEYANSFPDKLVVAVTTVGYSVNSSSCSITFGFNANTGCLNSLRYLQISLAVSFSSFTEPLHKLIADFVM